MWRWFRWVLLGIGLAIVIAVSVFLIMKPKTEEMENIAIPAFTDPECSRTFEPQLSKQQSYYEGSLFDTHFHIPSVFRSRFNKSSALLQQTVTLNDIVCELEKEKVVGAIAFYSPNPWLMINWQGPNVKDDTIQQWADQGKEIKKGLPEWVHLLYNAMSENKDEAQKIYNSYSDVFDGFGELVYLKGQSPRTDSKVDDEISLAIEKVANDNKLVVMAHPEQEDKAGLEKALQQNPDATFILHGWDHDDYVMDLMGKYPNFYFTLDAPEFYIEKGAYEGSEDKFITSFKENYQKNLEKAISQWKPQIERHPDRYLWGTDRYIAWHYSEEMGRNFEEFARAFIGQLNPEAQEYVAYRNAQRLFSSDKSDMPKLQNQQNNKSLGELPEEVRTCVIGKIGEAKWQELSERKRPATSEEEQIIGQCSHN